jgi:hypothetical protein
MPRVAFSVDAPTLGWAPSSPRAPSGLDRFDTRPDEAGGGSRRRSLYRVSLPTSSELRACRSIRRAAPALRWRASPYNDYRGWHRPCFGIVDTFDTCRNETRAQALPLTNFFQEERRRNRGGAVGIQRFRRADDRRPSLHYDNDNLIWSRSAAAEVWADPTFDLRSVLGHALVCDTYDFIPGLFGPATKSSLGVSGALNLARLRYVPL